MNSKLQLESTMLCESDYKRPYGYKFNCVNGEFLKISTLGKTNFDHIYVKGPKPRKNKARYNFSFKKTINQIQIEIKKLEKSIKLSAEEKKKVIQLKKTANVLKSTIEEGEKLIRSAKSRDVYNLIKDVTEDKFQLKDLQKQLKRYSMSSRRTN